MEKITDPMIALMRGNEAAAKYRARSAGRPDDIDITSDRPLRLAVTHRGADLLNGLRDVGWELRPIDLAKDDFTPLENFRAAFIDKVGKIPMSSPYYAGWVQAYYFICSWIDAQQVVENTEPVVDDRSLEEISNGILAIDDEGNLVKGPRFHDESKQYPSSNAIDAARMGASFGPGDPPPSTSDAFDFAINTIIELEAKIGQLRLALLVANAEGSDDAH